MTDTGIVENKGLKSKKFNEAHPAHGHRERLREKFHKHGGDVLSDYELLELALFRVFAQSDTKGIAKLLLNKFGSLSEILAAPEARLMEVKGIGLKAAIELKVIFAISQRIAHDEIIHREYLENWDKVIDYCTKRLAYETVEQFRVIYLTKINGIIEDRLHGNGTVDNAPVYPREIVKRALELSATALLLVHNHPSGDPKPSPADIQMTHKIVELSQPMGIFVHDHLIIGKNGYVSLKAEGHMG